MMAVPGVRELLQEAEVELLCDVQVPLTGPTGAIRLFGPQKGASPAHVEVLEAEMLQWAAQMREETGVDVLARPGAGAAGGLGAAFMAYAQPVVYPGIQRVLDLCHFDQAVSGASLVITGEGRSDRQTLQGKVPLGVLQRVRGGAAQGPCVPAASCIGAAPGILEAPGGAVSGLAASGKDAKPGQGAPVVLLSGRIDDARALQAAGFAQLIEVSPRILPLPEALAPSTARSNLCAAIQHLALD